jgi:putative RecB family exonuclease
MIAIIEPKKELQVSASKLNTWLSCRLRYYFKYILRLKAPKTGALYLGSTVHAVLKYWNRARWRKETITPDDLQKKYDEVWANEQKTESVKWFPDEEAGEKKHGWDLLEMYFKQSPIPENERPEGVEVQVEADLAKHGLPKIMGIIDLVRAGARVVDFKTVGQTPKDEKAAHQNEVQMSMYSLLYRESTGQQEAGRELHQLVKLKQPKLIITQLGAMTDQQETRLFKQLESFVTGLEREDFIPSPGLQCVACPYFDECRRWS